jgi:DNA-binding Xre family transcriptional regulator
MAIIINIDVMLAKRKMSVTELSEKVGITMANISVLKNGKAKAIRFSSWTESAGPPNASRGIFWSTAMRE